MFLIHSYNNKNKIESLIKPYILTFNDLRPFSFFCFLWKSKSLIRLKSEFLITLTELSKIPREKKATQTQNQGKQGTNLATLSLINISSLIKHSYTFLAQKVGHNCKTLLYFVFFNKTL